MIGGLPGNSFVFMQNEERGGVLQVTALLLAALDLEIAKDFERLVELAGEAVQLDAEIADEAVGVDDVEIDGGLFGGRVGGAVEQIGFEARDAVDAPGSVGEFLNEVGFSGGGGFEVVVKLAAVVLVGGCVFGGEDRGLSGKAVAQSVERRTLFAGIGARAGGMLGIGAIDGRAVEVKGWYG